jgi:Holliday junction DNA helicase RuvA
MYNYIKGKIVDLDPEKNVCIIDVNGLGYEIFVSKSTLEKLKIGQEIKFFIEEVAGGLYNSGLPNLYGFITKEERQIFLAFKNNLTNVGPKKALEYLDKVSKNLSEFWFSIQNKNYKMLTSLFGFRQSSAEKIVSSLNEIKNIKTKMLQNVDVIDVDKYEDITSALINLGYKEYLVRKIVNDVLRKNPSIDDISELIKLSLKEISEVEKK